MLIFVKNVICKSENTSTRTLWHLESLSDKFNVFTVCK